MEFQAGDIIEFGGLEGIILQIRSDTEYPLIVRLSNQEVISFTLKGLYSNTHTKPLLNLVKRPKKLVKKQIIGWANIYPGFTCFHNTEQLANNGHLRDRIACVKVTGEYEIEE